MPRRGGSAYRGKNIVYPDWAEMYLIFEIFEHKMEKQKSNKAELA